MIPPFGMSCSLHYRWFILNISQEKHPINLSHTLTQFSKNNFKDCDNFSSCQDAISSPGFTSLGLKISISEISVSSATALTSWSNFQFHPFLRLLSKPDKMPKTLAEKQSAKKKVHKVRNNTGVNISVAFKRWQERQKVGQRGCYLSSRQLTSCVILSYSLVM